MIKKRYLMILSVAVVSVLLGSLFYNNITQAQSGKFKTYKDYAEIVVLEWSAIFGVTPIFSVNADQRDCGVSPTPDSPITLVYLFSPKETFQNVTDLWIVFTAQNMHPGAQYIPLDITINDGATVYTNEFYENVNFGLKVVSVHVTDASIYQTITSGVNKLVLTTSAIILTVFRVTVFIEYTYQAR